MKKKDVLIIGLNPEISTTLKFAFSNDKATLLTSETFPDEYLASAFFDSILIHQTLFEQLNADQLSTLQEKSKERITVLMPLRKVKPPQNTAKIKYQVFPGNGHGWENLLS